MTKEEKIEYIVNHYTKLMHQKATSVLGDSYEAEDACQEAFLKLYRVMDRVSDVTTPEARSYCVMTAKNAAIDIARKLRHDTPCEEIYDEAASVFDVYPSDTADMLNDIEELPGKYKDVIRLRCFEDLSAEDTAKELATNVNTVNIRLLRARKILRSKWLAGAVSVLLICGLLLALGPSVQMKNSGESPAAEAAFAEEECVEDAMPAEIPEAVITGNAVAAPKEMPAGGTETGTAFFAEKEITEEETEAEAASVTENPEPALDKAVRDVTLPVVMAGLLLLCVAFLVRLRKKRH